MKIPVSIGDYKNFEFDDSESRYLFDSLKLYYSDDFANMYRPIIYSGLEYIHENDPTINPEGMYYRIVSDQLKGEYCIQYFIYWLEQNCTEFLNISNHRYDYEPIYVYIKPPNLIPVGVVNAGKSQILSFRCRFHKTEIRRVEYTNRDRVEYPYLFTSSPEPFFPFGGQNGRVGRNCIKTYPLAGSIYLDQLRPLFGINSCFHSFSGSESSLIGKPFNIPLRKLTDEILTTWFFNHYKNEDEEPFGHDVSNPFRFPFIQYIDPKPYLKRLCLEGSQ
ncbi:MAG: hypothetical protein ACE5SW_13415 [Nitrososphaeraceae archaeon]